MSQIKFIACKHLSFDKEKYGESCALNLLGGAQINAVWFRREPPYQGAPRLVQFCDLRGRINDPTACLRKCDAMCGDYEDFEHSVNTEDVDE